MSRLGTVRAAVLVAACVAASPALGAGAATEAAPLEIQGTLDAVTVYRGRRW